MRSAAALVRRPRHLPSLPPTECASAPAAKAVENTETGMLLLGSFVVTLGSFLASSLVAREQLSNGPEALRRAAQAGNRDVFTSGAMEGAVGRIRTVPGILPQVHVAALLRSALRLPQHAGHARHRRK